MMTTVNDCPITEVLPKATIEVLRRFYEQKQTGAITLNWKDGKVLTQEVREQIRELDSHS